MELVILYISIYQKSTMLMDIILILVDYKILYKCTYFIVLLFLCLLVWTACLLKVCWISCGLLYGRSTMGFSSLFGVSHLTLCLSAYGVIYNAFNIFIIMQTCELIKVSNNIKEKNILIYYFWLSVFLFYTIYINKNTNFNFFWDADLKLLFLFNNEGFISF